MAANVMEIYGSKVFNEHVMKERLPSATYKSLERTLHKGAPLDIEVAKPSGFDGRSFSKVIPNTISSKKTGTCLCRIVSFVNCLLSRSGI